MCCHQCSSSPASPTVAERPSNPDNTTLFSTLGTPLVQINYLGIQEMDASSVSINGAQYGGANRHSSVNLRRASTVSAVLPRRDEAVSSQKMDHAPTTCCSAGLNRAHSIHICIKTGSDHHKHCPRSHLPSKIGDSIRKKLSFITKLRKKSIRLAAPADDPRAIPRWLSRTPFASQSFSDTDSNYDADIGGPFAASRIPPAELWEESHFHPKARAAAPLASFPSQGLAEVDSTHLKELSDNAPAVAELRECQTLGPKVDAHVDRPKPPPMPVTQTSTVSAISSSWQGSISDYYSSRQYSAVSDFTPNTSISLPDGAYSYASSSKAVEHLSSSQIPLTLDTHLQVPPTTIMGGPLTDSPTDDEGRMPDKFIALDNHQSVGLLTTEDRGSNALIRTSVTSDPMSPNNHVEDVMQSLLPIDPSANNNYDDMEDVRYELDAGFSEIADYRYPVTPALDGTSPAISPDLFPPANDALPPSASLVLPSDISSSDLYFDSMPSTSTVECTGDVASRLVDACQQYALSWLHHPRDTLKTYLQDTFDMVLSHYLIYIDHPNRLRSMSSDKAWGVTPTIDAALIAVHRFLTGEDVPTPYQLVSLAFFSLSLLCLSVETHDLQQAVHTLHHHAKSWSFMIERARERALFEELIDNLWLLSEGKNLSSHVRAGVPGPASVVGTTAPMWWERDNFIIEVASVFISLVIQSNSQHVEPPPSFEEVMKEEQAKLLTALCGGESCPDPRDFHDALEQAQLMGLLTGFGSLESFTRREAAMSDSFIANHKTPLMEFLVKILGGRCIGRAALWLKEQLQSAASRVVSHPQGLSPTPMKPPPLPAPHAANLGPEALIGLTKRRARSQRGNARPPSRPKRSPKASASRKRKINAGVTPQGPFRCEEHDVNFTGEWAYDSYNRHFTGTISHGCEGRFKCPECGAGMPRIDHFKAHMRKSHNKMVRGRSGCYSFEDIVEDADLDSENDVVDEVPDDGNIGTIWGHGSGRGRTGGRARGRR